MRRLLRNVAVALAAVVILFEEWLWDPLQRAMAWISRWPPIGRLARAIAALPPRWALVVYLLPMAALLPFKLAGMWLIAQGHAVFGLITFLAAKVAGTALFAWLFGLTKPALLQVPWFARAYDRVRDISTAAHEWLRRQRLYRGIRIAARKLRQRIARMLRVGTRAECAHSESDDK